MKIDRNLKDAVLCGLIVMVGRPIFLGEFDFQVNKFFPNFIYGFLLGLVTSHLIDRFKEKK
ncbi:hypothetical protein ACO0K0_05315 [Undibacterium sp. SXout11W]|uniref:hypothetical protein n=1 Tax=Undibacterium sp. SXout11W TaxID=3413050 RepID=UPI003BF1EB6A